MPTSYLIDMDGVLVAGRTMIPGATEFIERLKAHGRAFLLLTNNALYTPADLSDRLRATGLDIPPQKIFTSALATARFLHAQKPGGSAFAIGETGLMTALEEVGYTLTEVEPDYVVLGETNSYDIRRITRAIQHIIAGARFIATNPDPTGPTDRGIVPACGAMAALIERASGITPYFVGKPNPLMIRTALNYLGAHSETAVMIGDRMDTDILTGVASGTETILVLSGITRREEIARYPYQPTHIFDSVADIDV